MRACWTTVATPCIRPAGEAIELRHAVKLEDQLPQAQHEAQQDEPTPAPQPPSHKLPVNNAVPQHIRLELERFINDNMPPCGFLQAVIRGEYDIARAGADCFLRADIIAYVLEDVPDHMLGTSV